ncbi:hypothetical protein GDO86_009897, partial [Hymenochirus boettgeri]
TDALHTNIKREWEFSALANLEFKTSMSCFEVAALCLSDQVCNRYLAALMMICKVNGNTCNITECQRTIQSFYATMPFGISQLLGLCDCNQFNEDCQRTGDVLHRNPCAIPADISTSCLNVIQSCLEDELCRLRYETFKSKCWTFVHWCGSDENCLLDINLEDLSCSGHDDCKRAYISTLGTKLHMQCTCGPELSTENQHLCRLFYHMLYSKSCFRSKDVAPPKQDLGSTALPRSSTPHQLLKSSTSISNYNMFIIAYFISVLHPEKGKNTI